MQAGFKFTTQNKESVVAICIPKGQVNVSSYPEGTHKLDNFVLNARKPVFGVSDQERLKPACSATESS